MNEQYDFVDKVDMDNPSKEEIELRLAVYRRLYLYGQLVRDQPLAMFARDRLNVWLGQKVAFHGDL